MTADDALFRFRVRALALAKEMGSVRVACRAIRIHPSTFYRWRHQADRFGLDILRPRERRAPRMPNATHQIVEQKVLALALGHPGSAPGGSPWSWPGRTGAQSTAWPWRPGAPGPWS